MPTLSERLKSLGVVVGARDLPPPAVKKSHPVEEIAPGKFLDTGNGLTYLMEADFPSSYLHGDIYLQLDTSMKMISEWAGNPEIAGRNPETLLFLDTETSGLAGGTGTFAFLVGAARYTPDGFHLAQFFMRDPLEEPALLLALENFIAPCQTVVSFNGKAFDVPLLNTRYTMQGWASPFKKLAHVDLLHLSRRLWRDRLPSRTLANLEVQILHAGRTDEEIPGWIIPELYFDYLRDGDARPLKRVFYHNAMDVVSLAALLNHTASLLEDPFSQPSSDVLDLAAVGRLMEELGYIDKAANLYETCIQADLPEDSHHQVVHRLALLHKHRSHFEAALPLWEKAALSKQVYAFEELAKYYEHQTVDLNSALQWTLKALELLGESGSLGAETSQWKAAFEHRLKRLKRKISAQMEG